MTKVEIEVKGKTLTIETGLFAKQSDGAAVLKYGDTVVLATAVADKKAKKDLDFFPLTIDYKEKTYAAGKIPGGFFKREGRPTEKEILTSRLIDRPIRPLFCDGFYSETQGIVSVLSFGDENISDVLGIIGISAALSISDIPFEGPVGAARIGIIDGSFVVNPDLEETGESDFNLVVAGTEKAVLMVEGGGVEIRESTLLEAIDIAHKEIKRIVDIQRQFTKLAGKNKRPVIPPVISEELINSVSNLSLEKIKESITIPDKLRRQDALNNILKDDIDALNTGETDISRDISVVFNNIEKRLVRDMILEKNSRADGRKPEEVREISCDVGILPRTHGSALFVRGETQCLAVVTLGTSEDEQRIDALEGDSRKTFMLHYNFPPFSVGEVKPLRGPGRREIGHGVLAEKALKAAIPQSSDFPYTIRIVADILESNGSSSMATVCGGTLALMDAGVPIKAPVAGIAMGLIKEGEKTVILTDILGLEDHLGDMDFKVTGTEEGITAFQMDVKAGDISSEIMGRALEQARHGRLHILKEMSKVLAEPRDNLATHAPRIFTMRINPGKIRDVIGPGGKIIRGIVEEAGVKIDINDEGNINIASTDEASAKKAMDIISGIVAEAELGKLYTGKIKRIMDFGAFVEILPGTEGLLHISQISNKRIAKVSDELKEGEEILVKVIEIDKTGRIRLSRKEVLSEQAEVES
ncbi:MAG: polyribonucleotide nucleotidyltransferase [Thermodesulfovibrionia bacterium]|nr:MAG: polyribonucleotide nucleotidyltransferase [Thermodesulfovibrionia bacterium]